MYCVSINPAAGSETTRCVVCQVSTSSNMCLCVPNVLILALRGCSAELSCLISKTDEVRFQKGRNLCFVVPAVSLPDCLCRSLWMLYLGKKSDGSE